jgi:hypothetical protein
MAIVDSYLYPAEEAPVSFSVNDGAASAEKAFGANAILAINATTDIFIKFGPAGSVTTPTALNSWRIPANAVFTFITPRNTPSFKVFNNSGGASNVYVQRFIL